MTNRCSTSFVIACAIAWIEGCSGTGPGLVIAPKARPSPGSALRFRAQELPFRYERGESGSAWPPETTGGGVGMLDFDGDGDLDLFFAQGVPLPVGKGDEPPSDVLLENLGGGRFEDASGRVGLASRGYGQGVTVADYDGDGDGDPDVYVARYGPNTLWRNDGGKFSDATSEAGVACGLWSLGAAFADLDGDGDLDLFVANYFDFDPKQAPFLRDPETGRADYGPPRQFVGQPDVLFRNEGGGRFVDVTERAGVAGKGRGMGVLASDLDGDGRGDLLVANDAEENALWRNKGDGTFEEVANTIGVAVNGEGQAEANMGLPWAIPTATASATWSSPTSSASTTPSGEPGGSPTAASPTATKPCQAASAPSADSWPAGAWPSATSTRTATSTWSSPPATSAGSQAKPITTRTHRTSGGTRARGDSPTRPPGPAPTSPPGTWAGGSPAATSTAMATSTSSSSTTTSPASSSGTSRRGKGTL